MSSLGIIKNGSVVTVSGILERTDVRLADGRVRDLGRFDGDGGGDALDATGCFVLPGLVDMHAHGGYGGDFMDACPESFDKALRFHAENGVTSILPTSVTAPADRLVRMVDAVRDYKAKPPEWCRVLGAHLEGPFLSMKNRGAHNPEHLKSPGADGYGFVVENKDAIAKLTVAPGLDGVEGLIAWAASAGILVSGGHDAAGRDSILAAMEAGMTGLTHWYCAMSTAVVRGRVRDVGLMEFGLADPRLHLELIADNRHLPPELVRMAFLCKGPAEICLVSDCLRAGGMPEDGRTYPLGTEDDASAGRFRVEGGVAVLEDGSRFAGSVQPLGKMIRNLVRDCGVSLVDAARTASFTPACAIGRESDIGSIQPGKYADICVMDRNLNVIHTLVDGRLVF